MKPKVSVIIPVYNAEKYLRECLDSVVNQTLKEIEIICVDAGSTDGSLDIIRGYMSADNRIRLLENLGRMDAGTARNKGLEKACGQFLSFLDADDFFDSHMLEKAYKKSISEKADIVVYGAKKLDMRTGKISDMPWALRVHRCPSASAFAPQEMAEYLFNSFQNWTWNKLFKTDFIRKNNIVFQSVKRTNDMAFVCEALAMAERITVLPQNLIIYRMNAGTSLQDTNWQEPTSFWEAYKETMYRLKDAGLFEIYKKSFNNAIINGGIYNINTIRDKKVLEGVVKLLSEEYITVFDFDCLDKKDFYDEDSYTRYIKMTTDYKKYCHDIVAERNKKNTRAKRLINKIRKTVKLVKQDGLTYTLKILTASFRNKK